MADHNVKLNYVELEVLPDPPDIFVRKGQTITFTPGAGVPAGAKVRVTIRDSACFSRPQFEDGQPDIEVTEDLPEATTYDCALVVGKEVLRGKNGGGMKPGSDEG